MKRLVAWGMGLALLWANTAGAVETVYYVHTDALGSPVAMTDANRNVVERTQYGPYGEVLNRPEHDGPGYTGHEEDAATGLTNMQQRYDDKVIGRFLSVDPVQPDGNTGGSFNRYAYANDNPYRYTDPDGRCPKGSSSSRCLEAQTTSPSSHKDIAGTTATDHAAVAARGRYAAGDGPHETIGTIGPDAKGDMKATPPVKNAATSDSPTGGHTASIPGQANAVAAIHGHLTDSGMIDQTKGGGDAGTLARNGIPNYTVSADGDRVSVHELVNGKVQDRMVRGTFTQHEQDVLQKNLNVEQQLFSPSANGGGQ